MSDMCSYSKDVSSATVVNLKCIVTDKPCPHYYICPVSKKPVMNSDYKQNGCEIQIKQEKLQKEQKKNQRSLKGAKYSEILAVTNYYNKAKNITAITYQSKDSYYGMFISGEYHGAIKIQYTNNEFKEENIINIIQM